jgi:hypothetical protein
MLKQGNWKKTKSHCQASTNPRFRLLLSVAGHRRNGTIPSMKVHQLWAQLPIATDDFLEEYGIHVVHDLHVALQQPLDPECKCTGCTQQLDTIPIPEKATRPSREPRDAETVYPRSQEGLYNSICAGQRLWKRHLRTSVSGAGSSLQRHGRSSSRPQSTRFPRTSTARSTARC